MKLKIKHGLLAVACIVLLSGCMVDQTDISKATKLCSDNGGIQGLRRDIVGKTTVIRCSNNATFLIDR